ncbi:Sperm-associated antigen 1A, partial [Xenoophorus captivus]
IHFSAFKQEGNDFVKKGQYQEALGKYTECLKLKPKECAIYTNRFEGSVSLPSTLLLCSFHR